MKLGINKNSQLAEAYKIDTVSIKTVDISKWYQDNIKIWADLTKGIEISE